MAEKATNVQNLQLASVPHVLIIPFPSQGHLLPLLDLVHHLSVRGLSLTIAVTPANLPLLSPLLAKCPPNSIKTLVIPFPSHPSIPSGVENAKDLPLPLFHAFMHTLVGLMDPLLSWARSNPKPVSLIISDSFLGWTQNLAAELGIPRMVFSSNGLLFTAVSHYLWLRMPRRPDPNDDNYPVSFKEVANSPVYPWCHLSWLYRTYVEGDPDSEFIKENFLLNLKSEFVVSNSFKALEGEEFRRSVQTLGFKRAWSVGPLAPTTGANDRGGVASMSTGEVMTWLDGCPDGSVVYVCFGTQMELSGEQVAALAGALALSGVRFVWVIKGTIAVPDGFEERTAERGRVIRGWAPQLAILNHAAVGWFLTHCGWNSVLEAITAGVAMLTWPMAADQFCNARVLVESAKVAVPAVEGMKAVPDIKELGGILKEMVCGGKDMRERAKELSAKAAEAVKEGGSSWQELEDLVEGIYKISNNIE
ncbi:flavonol 3-O-glucosyltransferase UGT89B1-like [Carex rostrata]